MQEDIPVNNNNTLKVKVKLQRDLASIQIRVRSMGIDSIANKTGYFKKYLEARLLKRPLGFLRSQDNDEKLLVVFQASMP